MYHNVMAIELNELAKNCLTCRNARCAAHCPCGNDIPAIIGAIKAGDETLAAEILHRTNPFPELTSRYCDHLRQCRGNCIRSIKGEPVDFPAMEKELSIRFPKHIEPGPNNGKRVVIIGAGPASLSAASFLIEAGFAVKIIEKEASLGGALLTGIPFFRFEVDLLKNIEDRLIQAGVNFEFNHEVNEEEIASLSKEFDIVVLAIGAEKENRLQAPDCPDIRSALPLLREFNFTKRMDSLDEKQNIVVMGGGNVAMDISRALRYIGKNVTLIYRRDEVSMPAQKAEIADAKEDGVAFQPLTNVDGYRLDEEGRLKALSFVSMGLGPLDESGRPSFFAIEGSSREFACDAFVMAIGEKPNVDALISPARREELGNVYLIGDCATGAKNIATAISQGREFAKSLLSD